ncbi:hypothetical protein ACEQPO_14025 [Bacillus sp. SL00103]
MQQEPVFDYQVYNEIGMSERSYTRLKGKTFPRPGLRAQ